MRHKKKRKPYMFLYVPFWLLIVSMFFGLIVMQIRSYEVYRQELDRLNTELVREQQIAIDLEYRQAFYGSDAYIERLAREKLRFVRQDEIVFRNIAAE